MTNLKTQCGESSWVLSADKEASSNYKCASPVPFLLSLRPADKILVSQAITAQLTQSRTPIPYIPILLSELSPAKLSLFNPHISTFVQTSCPRLSIDWGYAFERPLLSPYETAVAVGKAIGWMDSQNDGDKAEKSDGVYPMDFYAAATPWAISRTTASF